MWSGEFTSSPRRSPELRAKLPVRMLIHHTDDYHEVRTLLLPFPHFPSIPRILLWPRSLETMESAVRWILGQKCKLVVWPTVQNTPRCKQCNTNANSFFLFTIHISIKMISRAFRTSCSFAGSFTRGTKMWQSASTCVLQEQRQGLQQ